MMHVDCVCVCWICARVKAFCVWLAVGVKHVVVDEILA